MSEIEQAIEKIKSMLESATEETELTLLEVLVVLKKIQLQSTTAISCEVTHAGKSVVKSRHK